MFIALSRDQATQNSMRSLLQQFPGETVKTLSQIIYSDYDLTSLEEKPITRITVLGHAHDSLYGGMDSETFADHLIQILKKNDEASPGFSDRLEAIDLLGCELGFMNPETESYAMGVVSYLQKMGYHIPIHAFTIPDHTQNRFANTLLNRKIRITLHSEAIASWEFYGFKTREDMEKYKKYISLESEIHDKKIRKEAELYTLMETIRNVNTENIALEDSIDEIYIKTQIARDSLQAPDDQIKLERALVKWRQKVRDSRATIQNNISKLSILLETQERLTTHLAKLEKKAQVLLEYILDCSVQIAHTKNPREYFAQHPECNFTDLAHNHPIVTMDTVVTSKQTKQIELQELTEKIQALEVQNAKWQQSLERADLNIEQKRSEIDSPEAETEFMELMTHWQQQILARQLAIEDNTAAIRELSQTQQQISSEIEELDAKLVELTQQHQTDEKSVSDKSHTTQIVHKYKTSIQREKIALNQQPLRDPSIKPNSSRQ